MFEYLRDSREQKEAFDLLSQILFVTEPHVFNEVWQKYMPLFIKESAIAPQFFPVLQTVCTHESVSTQVVAILLKYLMENLAEFGEMSPQDSNMTLKLFKMAFTAINHYIHSNESILVPHLQKLILGCLEHSARATEPAVYYQVLRALFRWVPSIVQAGDL
jgi:transformation/transcription domain-associated protein